MKAVILAGGLGTRLRPVTYEIPKPLIPVQGKTLLEHVLDILRPAGVDEVYLSIGYKAGMIQKYFGDGSRFGMKIHYLIEDEALGTGGWMHLVKRIPGDFFVVNGDVLFDFDIKQFMEFHKRHKAMVSIALREVEDVTPFGVAEMKGDNIVRFVEKPTREEAPSNLINAGYYLFSEKAFDYIPNGKAFMLEKELFPVLAGKGMLFGFKSGGQWFDTGTFQAWDRVIHEWRRK
jgi:mannose-1-phosphate guanylyltransferase